METAELPALSKRLRGPWYRLWDLVERRFYRGRSYTLLAPYGHRVYTPWFEGSGSSPFADALAEATASGPMGVSPDRCYVLWQFLRRSIAVPGDVAECGVYVGGTAQLLCEALARAGDQRRLHLFDTFEGMPETVPGRDYHAEGDFSDTSFELVRRRLERYAAPVFHQGRMPETFTEVADVESYCFVHVDVDIYQSTVDACRHFWPRLSPGGAMVFDDYGFYPYRFACRAAVDEFFAEVGEEPIALPTGQAVVLKR